METNVKDYNYSTVLIPRRRRRHQVQNQLANWESPSRKGFLIRCHEKRAISQYVRFEIGQLNQLSANLVNKQAIPLLTPHPSSARSLVVYYYQSLGSEQTGLPSPLGWLACSALIKSDSIQLWPCNNAGCERKGYTSSSGPSIASYMSSSDSGVIIL